ncbi:MAG: M48 family metalloprotease [Arenicellales bacterium]|nr:M48 family metalloprotease [Arenicellales bacterium]
MKIRYGNSFLHTLWPVLALLLLVGCATNPVTGKQNFVLMSEEQEIDLGKQYHTEVMKQYEVYDDPELTALVERLGEELAANSHRSDLDFHFTVLDSPEVNAFALPGGYVYITRGIIAYMNNEEHLAGVLGHEIGHVTARHSVRQHAASTTANVFGAIATIATGSQGVSQLSSTLGGALVSGYGRSHELEADRLGAEYLAVTGYDPQTMLGVIGILKDQEAFELKRAREENRQPRIYHGLFSTHPDHDRRLQEVIAAAEKFKNPQAKHTNPESFLKLLDNLTFGHSENQGVVRGNRFYHKDLDFTIEFPQGWRIENQPDRLLAVSADNNAMFMVQIDNQKQSETPSAYLRRNFNNVRQVQSIDNDSSTGLVEGSHPFGSGTIRVAAAFHHDKVYVLHAAARYRLPDPQFIDSVKSIRSLDTRERELAEALHLRLIRARDGDTFASLANQSNLASYAEEQLRLLNGMYPDGEPSPGQLVKIVE